jgi:hypothetical protein
MGKQSAFNTPYQISKCFRRMKRNVHSNIAIYAHIWRHNCIRMKVYLGPLESIQLLMWIKLIASQKQLFLNDLLCRVSHAKLHCNIRPMS